MFAILFDDGKGQVLVIKDDTKDNPTLSFQFEIPDIGMVSQIFGFSTEEKRDAAFDSCTEERAVKIRDDNLTGVIEEVLGAGNAD